MTCCPTCGSTLPSDRIVVDLNVNVVAYGDDKVKLQPRQAELLSILLKNYPKPMARERLKALLFGHNLDEETGYAYVSVQIHHLRKRLKDLPMRIKNHTHVGYALEIKAPLLKVEK